MLGLYMKKPSELVIKEFLTFPLKDDEVRIKLIYGGICGSDVGVYKGKIPHASYPVIPGHELLGKIVEVGSSVEYKIGTKVVVQPNSYCGECEFCRKGKTNICSRKYSLGVNTDGGFLEEFVISSKYVIPVPNELSDERAILIEPFAVIVHAFQKLQVTKGTSIAIIGCGTEGMLAISLAKFIGLNVTAIDINEEKLDKVKNEFQVKTAVPEEVKDEMFDVVIEAAGVKAAVEQSVHIAKPGGTVVLIGLTPEANVPVVKVVRKELTIQGSIIYQCPVDFTKAIEYLMDPDFVTDAVISKIIPFHQYEEAYQVACSGEYGKIILNFKD